MLDYYVDVSKKLLYRNDDKGKPPIISIELTYVTMYIPKNTKKLMYEMKYVTKQGFIARTQFRKQSASVNIWSFPLEGQAKFIKHR